MKLCSVVCSVFCFFVFLNVFSVKAMQKNCQDLLYCSNYVEAYKVRCTAEHAESVISFLHS